MTIHSRLFKPSCVNDRGPVPFAIRRKCKFSQPGIPMILIRKYIHTTQTYVLQSPLKTNKSEYHLPNIDNNTFFIFWRVHPHWTWPPLEPLDGDLISSEVPLSFCLLVYTYAHLQTRTRRSGDLTLELPWTVLIIEIALIRKFNVYFCLGLAAEGKCAFVVIMPLESLITESGGRSTSAIRCESDRRAEG